MASSDPIPSGDQDFNTLQDGLVTAVTTNAVAWGIPAAEITKLTDKQTVWNATWAIAQHKLTATTAQRQAKDDARKAFEKVLRPFIQKWIYRNEAMTNANVEECGLKPRDTTPTEATPPAIPTDVKAKRGDTGKILTECKTQVNTTWFGAIVSAGQPLPANLNINEQGQLVAIKGDEPKPDLAAAANSIIVIVDLNKSRKKKFAALTPGVDYYIYYYAANANGVSGLSIPVVIKCW